MAAIRRRSRRRFHERAELISPREKRRINMPGGLTIALPIRERLERARSAAASLAQFSTDQKNRLLLQMADSLEAGTVQIVRANEEDLKHAHLSDSLRD